MRLTLAVSMLKHADLVLLDEPTNHLDEESVGWLGEYVKTIKEFLRDGESHEPKFLDRICTHTIAYVDETLEYTDGDFHAFAAARGPAEEQIDAMLSGNLSFGTEKKED
jgi:ATPase subunit of ABC transporter with duplicated ATPase domains